MKIQEVQTADNHSFEVRITEVENAAGVLVFFPAMGVRAGYYDKLASELAQRGWTTVVAELRGHGSSSIRASRTVNWGYRDMVEQDWPAVMAVAHAIAGGGPVAIGGHSLGGQLSCLYLADNPDQASAILLVASCTVYWKMWDGRQRKGMFLVPRIAPLLSAIVGHFPGESVNFAGREGRQQMYDWSYNGRTGLYKLPGDAEPREARMATLQKPVLSISFVGDSYAPAKACSHLTAKLSRCDVTRMHLDEEKVPAAILHHFQWAREAETVADIAAAYLRTHVK